jgi:hypothetical protein
MLPPDLAAMINNFKADSWDRYVEHYDNKTDVPRRGAYVDEMTPRLHRALQTPGIGDAIVVFDRTDGREVPLKLSVVILCIRQS